MKGIIKTSTRTILVKVRLGNSARPSDILVTARETTIPGLVVHRDIDQRGNQLLKGWSITHEASGRAIRAGIDSFMTARRIIDLLADSGVDWTQSRSEVRTKENARRFRAILDSMDAA